MHLTSGGYFIDPSKQALEKPAKDSAASEVITLTVPSKLTNQFTTFEVFLLINYPLIYTTQG